MLTPLNDPNSRSKLDFDGPDLTWKSGVTVQSKKGGAFPILLIGAILCGLIVVLFFKASQSGARNESHLAKLEEAKVSPAPSPSAYVPTARREELPSPILVPSSQEQPEASATESSESVPTEVARIGNLPELAPEPIVPTPIPEPEPEPEVTPPTPEPPRTKPPEAPVGRVVQTRRQIGDTTFALINPAVTSSPVFISTRPISREFFAPFARQRNRAMVLSPMATVSRTEAIDFANWLTQVHRSRGLIGRNEYYRLPTTLENPDRNTWHADNRSSSNSRRGFRLTLTGDGPALRPTSG